MNGARRLLLLGGIALAAWGMGYGLWYAAFAEHQALDRIGASLTGAFSAAAQRDHSDAVASVDQYKEAKYAYDRQVDVHSHWIGLAMLLVVIAVGFDRVHFSESLKVLLVVGLLLGALIFPLGVWLQTFSHGAFPRVVAVAGSGLMIFALATTILGFARSPREGLKR